MDSLIRNEGLMDSNEALELVNRMYVRLSNRRPEVDKFERY